jgi:hypothetical protein
MMNGIGSMARSASRITLIFTLCMNLVTLGWAPAAQAQVVGTAAFNHSMARDAQIERVNNFLTQDAVRGHLIGLGVDPNDAQARVAALTDSELEMLSQRIDAMPAGGDSFLAVIGIVFLVLVILELLGVTNIFKNF